MQKRTIEYKTVKSFLKLLLKFIKEKTVLQIARLPISMVSRKSSCLIVRMMSGTASSIKDKRHICNDMRFSFLTCFISGIRIF